MLDKYCNNKVKTHNNTYFTRFYDCMKEEKYDFSFSIRNLNLYQLFKERLNEAELIK